LEKSSLMSELNLLHRVANRDMHAIIGDDGLPVALPEPGQSIGGLRIGVELGRGGVGAVFMATDLDAETVRAVKIPFPDSSRRDLDRFRMEAKIGANLEHANIVRVYKIGYLKGVLPYTEMDYVPGKSLRDYLKENPLPVPVGLSIVAVLCQALEYIHSQSFVIDGKTYERLIHRDIKPSNIIISDKGIVKLLDFGLAKFEDVELNNTITGALPGTPAYMAPEQHQKSVANVKTDIYSIGVTFYEAITGVRPFPEEGEDSFIRMIAAKNTGAFKPASALVKHIPPKVDEIIKRCLHPEPSKRYPTYAPLRMAVITVLDEYARINPDSLVKMYVSNNKAYAVAVSDKIARGKIKVPKWLLLGAVGIVILAAIAGLIVMQSGNKTPEVAIPSPQESSVKAVLRNDRPPKSNEDEYQKIPHELKQPVAKQPIVPEVSKPAEAVVRTSVVEPAPPRTIEGKKDKSPIAHAVQEFKDGNYRAALDRFSKIDIDNLRAIERDSVVLLTIESYYRSDRFNDGLAYGQEHATSDAKYHLLMALLYDFASMKDQAEASFTKAISAPAKFDPSNKARAYLFRARFYQRQFTTDGSEQTREKMIDAWKDLLSKGCSRPSADCDEARRIVGGN
jgi:serine/threonine protein kinase